MRKKLHVFDYTKKKRGAAPLRGPMREGFRPAQALLCIPVSRHPGHATWCCDALPRWCVFAYDSATHCA